MTINNDKCDRLQSTDVLITEAERGDNWSLAHEWVQTAGLPRMQWYTKKIQLSNCLKEYNLIS